MGLGTHEEEHQFWMVQKKLIKGQFYLNWDMDPEPARKSVFFFPRTWGVGGRKLKLTGKLRGLEAEELLEGKAPLL